MGGGPDPNDFNKPTEVEEAQAETAAKMFNLYLEGKPVTDDYLQDISKDPSITAQAVQGQAAVDMAKKAAPTFNPNRGMNPTAAVGQATTRAKVMNDIGQDAVAQQSAGMKTSVENALGIQSSANTAQQGMAADAVSRNINKAQSDYNSSAATNSSLASLAGSGAGMAFANYKNGGKQ